MKAGLRHAIFSLALFMGAVLMCCTPVLRRRYAEPIPTAFVESTVNLVVAKRFAKKQQMQWSKAGAHRLLQTRARTLDGTLRDLFTTWYPAMTANDTQILAAATAA
jgi:hypothetical protein